MEDDDIPEFEAMKCPTCGGVITVVKMDYRFAARYTCPHCGNSVLLSDESEETN